MKNFLITTTTAAMVLLGLTTSVHAQSTAAQDTVVINFGNESKIIIYLTDKEDLETLIQYDINSMLQDLHLEIQEGEGEIKYLKIEDPSGERYLMDTTIIIDGQHYASEQQEDDDEMMDEIDTTENHVKIKKQSRSNHRFNVELGLNNYLEDGNLGATNSEDYSVKPFGSWYVGLTSKMKTHVGGKFFLEWGGGVSWYNFKMENTDMRILKRDERVIFEESQADIKGLKSKLTATYINISLIPLLDFGKHKKNAPFNFLGDFSHYNNQAFRIGFGPYIGYRLDSYAKYKFEENNKVKKDRDKNSFYLENLRYGLRFQMGYKGLDVFAQYDLNPLFRTNHGPELNAFSFGIIL